MENFNLNNEEADVNEPAKPVETSTVEEDGYDPKICNIIMSELMNTNYGKDIRRSKQYHQLAVDHPDIVTMLENIHEAEIGRYKHLLGRAYNHIMATEKRHDEIVKSKDEELTKANSKHPKLRIIFIGLSSILLFFIIGSVVFFILGKADPVVFDKTIKALGELNKSVTILKDKVL